MKTAWRTELPQLALLAAMFIAAALCWSRVPDRVPVHWNIAGEVDRYGGRFEALLVPPLIALGLYALLLFLPRIDPGRANYARFRTAYLVIRYALLLFMAGVYAMLLLAAFGRSIDVGLVAPVAVGALFVVLGFTMRTIRPNWFVGVRTPWTLSSELSWTKTHRLAGWLFGVMGLCFASLAFVRTGWAVWCVLGIAGGCVVWMVIYSYLVWRSDPLQTPLPGTRPNGDPQRVASSR